MARPSFLKAIILSTLFQMSNIQQQIHRLENILSKGYTMRPTVTGGTYIQRRENMPSIIHRNVEKVTLTKGRRRMVEQQLKALKRQGIMLWPSKMADTVMNGRVRQIDIKGHRKPLLIKEKPTIIKGEIIQGTYDHRLHGELKRNR